MDDKTKFLVKQGVCIEAIKVRHTLSSRFEFLSNRIDGAVIKDYSY